MKEAMLYEKLGDGRVRCNLCAHRCVISPGHRGICAVRENRDGTLYSLVYGKAISLAVDPIEKKPLFHFLPGSRTYSVATVGCNFTCLNCQNYTISQYPREHNGQVIGEEISPAEIVTDAVERGCQTIAYTYTEPTIFFEYAYDTARLGREKGLRNVFVSNGYMTEEAVEEIVPYLDGINIDLKGISDEFYRKIAGGTLRPVLRSIERFHRAGVWVEVTTLVIPGMNDSDDDLRWIAEAIYGISPAIPWHISRFYPAYRLRDVPPTPVATLRRAREIGKEVGLRYVYLGNVPGEGESTYCPHCGAKLIKRIGFAVVENRLQDGHCPKCGAPIDGVFLTG
ncbi:AmmeMemoRadiSam system radical SAM enzyme [Candidatus Acetothermia bacterium]|nr:MAG: AmmeMemoRadiSam system radical SAM enzyme [Candidatus Acetothermia bacterium]